eukprot:g79129.t1
MYLLPKFLFYQGHGNVLVYQHESAKFTIRKPDGRNGWKNVVVNSAESYKLDILLMAMFGCQNSVHLILDLSLGVASDTIPAAKASAGSSAVAGELGTTSSHQPPSTISAGSQPLAQEKSESQVFEADGESSISSRSSPRKKAKGKESSATVKHIGPMDRFMRTGPSSVTDPSWGSSCMVLRAGGTSPEQKHYAPLAQPQLPLNLGSDQEVGYLVNDEKNV